MHVTSNERRVLVQMTIVRKSKPHVATVIPEVTQKVMERVADTLRITMSVHVEKVEVRESDRRLGFYNFYVYPKPGRRFSDAEVRFIRDRTLQAWQAAGLPTT